MFLEQCQHFFKLTIHNNLFVFTSISPDQVTLQGEAGGALRKVM